MQVSAAIRSDVVKLISRILAEIKVKSRNTQTTSRAMIDFFDIMPNQSVGQRSKCKVKLVALPLIFEPKI